MKTFQTLLLLMLTLTVAGQESRPWEQLLAEVLTVEDMEAADWEDTYDLLCALEQQPLNLNTAAREELESLPFLSARQVEAVVEYLYR